MQGMIVLLITIVMVLSLVQMVFAKEQRMVRVAMIHVMLDCSVKSLMAMEFVPHFLMLVIHVQAIALQLPIVPVIVFRSIASQMVSFPLILMQFIVNLV
jgi:hypothetical protein